MTRSKKSTGTAPAQTQPQRRGKRRARREPAHEQGIMLPSVSRAGGAALRGRNVQHVAFRQRLAAVTSRFCPGIDTFPTVFAAPFRWAVQIDDTTDVGSAVVNAFSLNSLYDPNVTGAGTQPKFFDTLCAAAGGTAPYDTYVVVRAHGRVTFQSNSTTSIFGYVQVYSDTAGISPTCPMYEYLEAANLVKVVMTSANNQTAVRVVEFSVDIAKFLGCEDILDTDYARAQYDASPARQVYMDVGVRSNTDTSGSSAFSYTVEIVYESILVGLNDTTAFLAKRAEETAMIKAVAAANRQLPGGVPVRPDPRQDTRSPIYKKL